MRRMLCLIYEALLFAAVAFAATFVFLVVAQLAHTHFPRAFLQAYLLAIGAAYFAPQWRRGQTLPMKTWGVRVVTTEGERLSLARATGRYGLAVGSCLLAGAGFLWALVDSDRQFLHDRLARTRLVRLSR